MIFNKLVIPSAGTGSRVGTFTKQINKGLITLGRKPSICHVIDMFPENIEVVVVLGYKGDLLKDVLESFYKDKRKISYVTVAKFEGPDSGLSVSLEAAESLLQEPFLFISNDTILEEKLAVNHYGLFSEAKNFVGYFHTEASVEVAEYRTVDVAGKALISLNRKAIPNKHDVYLGFCGIVNFEAFWVGMHENESRTIGESAGIQYLLNQGFAVEAYGQFGSWFDVGSAPRLEEAQKHFRDFEHNVLDKDGEAIWFSDDGRIVKFSVDTKFIQSRVGRSRKMISSLATSADFHVPQIISYNQYTYVYRYVEGETISQAVENGRFTAGRDFGDLITRLLEQYRGNYVEVPESGVEVQELLNFYVRKTEERILKYFERFEVSEPEVEVINGTEYGRVLDLIRSDQFCKGMCNGPLFSSFFHGDLHFENIIWSVARKEFTLIDWRQSFGALDDVGDIYYDLGKLLHGLLINHGEIRKGNYFVKRISHDIVNFDVKTSYAYSCFIKLFESLIQDALGEHGLMKVKAMAAVVFLNIAALHEPFEYCELLFLLGKSLLFDCLSDAKAGPAEKKG